MYKIVSLTLSDCVAIYWNKMIVSDWNDLYSDIWNILELYDENDINLSMF